jgi:hypothetical protein
MPRAAAPPCEPRQPFDQAGAEAQKSRPLSGFFAIDSCLFSTSDAETAWLSCIAGFHTSILVFATYIGLGQKTNALAQRCNASRGQQAVGVDHRSVDLNPSTKKPPPARRTLERLRDIMGEDDEMISLASERDRHTEQARGAPAERV